jgi:hypothetical protein
MGYAIRLLANSILQRKIGYLLKRPVGRPPRELRRYFASSSYRAQAGRSRAVSWPRSSGIRGELYPCVGFIVTNLARPPSESPSTTSAAWRSSGSKRAGRDQVDAAVMPNLRRQRCASPAPYAGLYLGNFMRTLAIPKAAEPWSLTSLREKLIKIRAKVISHGRYVTFQMAGVAVSRQMFADILSLIARLRAPPAPA